MKKYTDPIWLREAYIERKLSILEIAQLCGVSRMCIHKRLVRYDIPRRGFHGLPGAKSGHWKGGRVRNAVGYIWVFVPGPHLHKIGGRARYVPEQILIAEKTLGRLLTSVEIIHHINEIKDDNRPENLFLFPNDSEHQRHHANMRNGSEAPITKSNLLL